MSAEIPRPTTAVVREEPRFHHRDGASPHGAASQPFSDGRSHTACRKVDIQCAILSVEALRDYPAPTASLPRGSIRGYLLSGGVPFDARENMFAEKIHHRCSCLQSYLNEPESLVLKNRLQA